MNRIHPKDSLVVITGAGSGIGAAVALLYAELGATVVAVDINESSALLTAQACCAGGGNAYGYACNVADASAVDEIANRVEQVHGPVDVLVNNAGVGVGGPFLDGSLDDWIWLRSVNIDGVVHGCRAFGPAMVERGRGHVVNIASGAGYVPNKRMATYCASKAAVIMLSRCLRADWASGGVGVSVICPGVINTAIAERARLRGSAIDERDRITKAFRMSHSPDAVAEAVVGAVSHNRAIVSVGIEAQVAYHLLRLLPAPVHDLVARI